MEKRRERRRKRDASKPLKATAKPAEDQSQTFITADESVDGRGSIRRGPKYEAFVASGWAQRILEGEASQAAVADLLDEVPANISRWMIAYRRDVSDDRAMADWSQPPEVAECLEDFGAFCRRYWPESHITGFQMEWADLISDTIDTGGRLLLLAPQRHGKSELLRKYCVWRICKDPDIRIIWVAQAATVAKRTGSWLLDTLTTHEKLQREMLGPGQEFRPPTRQNMSWTAEEFTVGHRTKVQASPTMMILGKTGSMLSRDADLLIVDDYQEHKHIRTPTVRDEDEQRFFTDLMSRKLPATGLVVIGSRQHVDDIYSRILKRPDQWTIRTYQVHDPACDVPESDHTSHDGVPVGKFHIEPYEQSCMLWSWQYPHWYMQEQRKQQGEAYFQRNMMNNPQDNATTYITADELDNIKDHTRRAGDIPSGCRLIVGVDPAESKPVAAVLWGYDGIHRHVIDCIEASASVVGLREILSTWPDKYGVREFVFEKNMAKSWLKDTEVKAIRDAKRLHIREHYTSKTNKNSNAIGPVAMFQRMRTEPPTITVPWGAGEGRERIQRLLRSWLTFDPDYAGFKHADDDLTMASWFPMPVIDSWERPSGSSMVVQYDTVSNPLGGF